MLHLLTIIFYQPIFNLLVWIYNLVGDMGVAIVLLTLVIKLVLYPLSKKSVTSQRALQELQPKVEALKVKFKGEKDKLAKELMQLYQSEKVSPLSSCLPLLVQLPFLIALYQVFNSGLRSPDSLSLLYPFIHNPGTLSHIAFGSWDLLAASWPLAVAAGLAQFWQSKMLVTKKPAVSGEASKDEGQAAMMNKQMLYVMPAITVIIGFKLPSGLIVYWLVNILFTIVQQYLTFKKHDPKPAAA
jgi:YidC/Oxa1 family membrane protein insertase